MNLNEWQTKAEEKLRSLAITMNNSASQWNPGLLYGTLSTAIIFPLVEAARHAIDAQDYPMLMTLGALASGIGGNLVAEHISRWHHRTEEELAIELTQNAKTDEEWRKALDGLLERFGALRVTQTVMSETDKDWFVQTLKKALKEVGSQLIIQGNLIQIGSISNNTGIAFSKQITQIINQYRRDDKEIDEQPLQRQISYYLRWIQGRYGAIDLRGLYRGGRQVLQLDLETVYVPLKARQYSGHIIDMNKILQQGDRLVITGGPGCGKTTVLQYIAYTLATAILEDSPTLAKEKLGLVTTKQGTNQTTIPLPVIVPLGLYAQNRQHSHSALEPFLSYLIEKQYGLDLPQDFFVRLLRTGQAVMLLLDGLDEVPNEKEQILVRQAIENLVTGRELLHVIVTSRTAAYQGRSVLGRGFNEVQIQALDNLQVQALVQRAYQAIYPTDENRQTIMQEELLRGIHDLEAERRQRMGDEYGRLVYSPLMVRMLLILHLSERRLPENRTELYMRVTDALLWPEHTLDEAAAERVGRLVGGSVAVHREMIQYLAFHMHREGPEQGTRISESNVRFILRRVQEFVPLIDDFLAVTRLRGTLLEERMGHYSFVHLTFQEYLAARYLAEVVRGEGGIEAIVRFFEDGPILESWWRETVFLVAGYLNHYARRSAHHFLQRMAGIDRPADVATALSPNILAACIEVAGLAILELNLPELFPPLEMAIQYIVQAGFELLGRSERSLFLCKPNHRVWSERLSKPIIVKILYGAVLEMSTILDLIEEGTQLLSEKPHYIIVICDQLPSNDAWLQIAALRAVGILVMPVDDSVLRDGRQQNRHLAVFLDHLEERYLGPQRDLYDRQNPISDRLNFFGREPLADQLADNLQQGHAIALFGLRKMGKSSLLNYVRDRLLYPAAVIDLQVSTVLKDMYDRIVDAWLARLQTLQPTLNWQPPPLSGDETPSVYFSRIVRGLLAALEGVRAPAQLAVFVDEIELIYPHTEPELTMYLDFARTLRGLAQEQLGKFGLIVAGVDPNIVRTNRLFGQQNPFYNFFRIQYLPPLNEQDCIQMIRNIGVQMGLQYTDDALAFVAYISGGHPYWARKLCSLAFKTWKEPRPITQAHLATVARRFVQNPDTAQLLDQRGLWGEVTDRYLWQEDDAAANEAILLALAETEQRTRTDLLAHAAKPMAYQRSLAELDDRAIIDEVATDAFWIHLHLFRNWIRTDKLGKE